MGDSPDVGPATGHEGTTSLQLLLDSFVAITSELNAAAILERAVDLARLLTSARYGAAVALDNGEIAEFVHAGLVKSEGKDGRRVFEITDAGREELAARQDGREPWEDGGEDPFHELKGSAFQLGAAAMQVARTGSADQVARAKQILDEARKKIYGILAEA